MVSILVIKVAFILATLTLAVASVFSKRDDDSSARYGMLYILFLLLTGLVFGDYINQYLVQFKPNSGIDIDFVFSTAVPLSLCLTVLLVWPMAVNKWLTLKRVKTKE